MVHAPGLAVCYEKLVLHHCAQLIKAFCLIIRFNFIHVLTLAYTVNFLGPFWPQKWGQIFDPETAPYGGAILAPYGGAILAPKTGPNF